MPNRIRQLFLKEVFWNDGTVIFGKEGFFNIKNEEK